jgi:hypothetical protein
MKLNFKALVLTSAAFCATAAFAANQARVNVPFSFTAKGHAYPAGAYDIMLDANRNFVTMANQANTQHITWTVGPAEPAASAALVKFDQVGSDYALKSIQLGARVTPNLDQQNKRGITATTSISGQ